jgi:hypothetical protein
MIFYKKSNNKHVKENKIIYVNNNNLFSILKIHKLHKDGLKYPEALILNNPNIKVLRILIEWDKPLFIKDKINLLDFISSILYHI